MWFHDIFEIPLALLSWAAYRLMRRVWGARETGYTRPQNVWEPLYASRLLHNPAFVMRQMLVSPRWNTAAALGLVNVTHTEPLVRLRVMDAHVLPPHWTLVVYDVDTARTIAAANAHATEITLPGPRHSLRLSIRLYGDADVFPAVCVEDATGGSVDVPAAPADAARCVDWSKLARHPLHRALHWHVHTALRWQEWLPRAWLRHLLLPVGNPHTRYRYGAVRRGESLHVQLLEPCDECHITVYSRASHPLFVSRIVGDSCTTPPCEDDGFYVLRALVPVVATHARNPTDNPTVATPDLESRVVCIPAP